MQNAQVPAWLALLATVGAALIGATGPVLAQLVTSRREEKRWRRERHAESVRLAHEHAVQWRDSKVRAYGDYLLKLRELEYLVGAARMDRDVRHVAEYRRLRDALSERSAEIRLLCSGEMLEFLGAQAREIDQFRIPDAELLADEALLERAADVVGRYRKGFVEMARQELAVAAPVIGEPE
ncbi:hypothetical protein [Saccharothrix sp.]|uniref:hypothetical protein n=1 Tax=Saccharothrix sp. TaxID=1873460 RepID=UPI0028109E90|nr:hypothetical protein [Saccharothrix sp.]